MKCAHFALACLLMPALPATTPPPEPFTTAEVLRLVSQAHYTRFIRDLLPTGPGSNRSFSGTPLRPSADHESTRLLLLDHFARHGWAVVEQDLVIDSPLTLGAKNIIATKLGSVRPNEVHLIGAHYDTVGAPGYEDNGSGIAALMEAARVLAFVRTEATIRLVAFDREEAGLLGSHRYAVQEIAAGTNLRGVLNLDMIGHNHAGNDVCWVGRVGISGSATMSISETLREDVARAVIAYGQGLTPVRGTLNASDHAAFDVPDFRFIPAVQLTVERNPANSNKTFNPFYHNLTDHRDTPGNVDLAYATRMTRSAIGWVLDATVLAGRQNPPITRRLTVQPVKVAKSDGSGVVNDAETLFEDIGDRIAAQAGIDLTFLPFRRINDDRAWTPDTAFDDPTSPIRDAQRLVGSVNGALLHYLSDLGTGSEYDVGISPSTASMWFVRSISSGGFGYAQLHGRVTAIHAKTVGDPNHGFGPADMSRDSLMHELGHNLGLHQQSGRRLRGDHSLPDAHFAREGPGSQRCL